MPKQTKSVPIAPAASAIPNEATADQNPAPRGRRPARVAIDPPTKKRSANGPKDALGTKATHAPAASKPRQMAVEGALKAVRRGREAAPKRPSALDAAAKVLAGLTGAEAKEGVAAPDLIERMAKAKLWSSPGGKTPAATLYAAMIREINAKGKASRFVRPSPGRFRAAAGGRGKTS